jgi:hypothetical protein
MDHIKLLKRALHITFNYRALWVFGILLALTAGGNGGGNGGGSGNNNSTSTGTNTWPKDWPQPDFHWTQTPEFVNTLIGIIIAVACLILVLIVAFTIARYVAETASIRMVNRYEDSGEQITVREGFRLGWTSAAGRMFWMDLLVGLGFLVAFLTALIIAGTPFLVWLGQNDVMRVIGSIVGGGLVMLVIGVTVLAAIALNLVLLVARRAIVLEEMGWVDALKRGYALARQRLGDIVLMGVILFGLGLLFALVTIPVGLIVLAAGVIVAGLPALLIGWIVGLFTQTVTQWIVTAAVGIPLLIIVVSIPCLLIEGWAQIFASSTWTLFYREAVAMEKTQGEALPAPEAA